MLLYLSSSKYCDDWIEERLDGAIGKEMADEVRLEALLNPNNVEKDLIRVKEDGGTLKQTIDKNGHKK